MLEKFGNRLTAPQNCNSQKENFEMNSKNEFSNHKNDLKSPKENRYITLALNALVNIGLFFKMF